MKISWNCLNQIIDLEYLSITEVTHKLTLAGFEVENIRNDLTMSDTIFDVNLTSNRQDVIGFIHIAIELSALFNIPLKIYKNVNSFNSNVDLKECGYIIKNINIKKSNRHIIKYLDKFNFTITHTILDIIHFINLKWGQRIKIYELDTAKKKKEHPYSIEIKIDNTNEEEVYTTNSKTNEITIENVNNERKAHSFLIVNHSNHDSSNHFSSFAYQEIFKILNIQCQELIIPRLQVNISKHEQHINKIICDIDTIQNILGPTKQNYDIPLFDIKTIINTLEKLNFRINKIKNQLKIDIPKERAHDIYNEIDIVEEIGRIYGFNNFIDKLPKFKKIDSTFHLSYFNQKLRRILRSMGLHEIVNYSLQGTQDNTKCRIVNPINQSQSILRNNLIENIISSKLHNTHQDNEPFEVFELGTIFSKGKVNQLYQESKHLCCLMGNNHFNQSTWYNKKSQLTWYQAKGHIEDLLERINAKIIWSTTQDNNDFVYSLSKYIHPTRHIYISHNQSTIGILSQLNHRINNLIHLNHNTYFFEIDIIQLSKTIKASKHLKYRYTAYSVYPKVTRDLSVKVHSKLCIQDVFDIIHNIKKDAGQMIESVKILNEYRYSKNIKTICIRITFRSLYKTLTNEEVEILDNIFKKKFHSAIKSKT